MRWKPGVVAALVAVGAMAVPASAAYVEFGGTHTWGDCTIEEEAIGKFIHEDDKLVVYYTGDPSDTCTGDITLIARGPNGGLRGKTTAPLNKGVVGTVVPNFKDLEVTVRVELSDRTMIVRYGEPDWVDD